MSKPVLFIIVIASIAGAYAGGFWPEHRRLLQADEENRLLQSRLDSADARIRLGEILGRLFRLSDAVAARNFGEASTLSSAYFDRVQREAPATQQPGVKRTLERILQSRDQVTAALARTEPAVSASLREQELELRGALEYPVEPTSTTRQSPK